MCMENRLVSTVAERIISFHFIPLDFWTDTSSHLMGHSISPNTNGSRISTEIVRVSVLRILASPFVYLCITSQIQVVV